MNRVILLGNTGRDPDVRDINDSKVAKFSFATNKVYKNKQGEKTTETQWHNIVMWGRLAETASKYIKKGISLIIEGEIAYRSYENKEGQTVYITEIIASNLHFFGSKDDKPKEDKPRDSGKREVKAMSDINELPGNVADYNEIPDDLPYQ